MAALGAIIVCWATIGYERLASWLDACRVRFRPEQIGLNYDELKRSLEFATEYFRTRERDSVLVTEPVVGNRFDRMWEDIEGC